MKIVHQDLLNFLSEKPSVELLSEKLFQLGHEHEIDGDIFEMEFTPNRGDCLSLLGLARDLNIFFGSSKHIEIYEGKVEELELDFENLSKSDCPKISFLDIEIKDFPKNYLPYMENYFKKLQIKKTNFFTDVSNYLSYELGQPTHCYERSKINKKIKFEKKQLNESFKTLLGSDIKLNGHNCVFFLDDEVINLAGIMGGMSTACSNNTKRSLVECAYFKPESIIGKSLKYALTSDAAFKFERGVDISSHDYVLRRFIKIVEDHADLIRLQVRTFESKVQKPKEIEINHQEINNILGTSLKREEYLYYLNKLGFTIRDKILIPSHRGDVSSQNDLSEEVARLIGYNNIVDSPIRLIGDKDKQVNTDECKIKDFLIMNGFSEVINYPFQEKSSKRSLKVDNPLDSNKSFMREDLEESLIRNLLFNERRQKDSIKLFEISDVYHLNKGIEHHRKIGIIASGRVGHNYQDFKKNIDQSYLDIVFNNPSSNLDFCFKEISRDKLDTKIKSKIFYFETKISNLSQHFLESYVNKIHFQGFHQYKETSEFPSSTRDISLQINKLSAVDQVISLVEKISIKILKDLFMFDFYKNNKTNEVKIGYRFIFQSNLRTLTESDINEAMDDIIDQILSIDGVSIPGLNLKN